MTQLAGQPDAAATPATPGRSRRSGRAASLPTRWPWLVRGFVRYGRRYVGRNFHAVRLLRDGDAPAAEALADRPVILAMNHPSWWDPMIALIAADRFFPERSHFAAIDAKAVQKYRFFEKLGFFGVERGTRCGAASFLRAGLAVCDSPSSALWVTVQGGFTDVRVRPVEVEPGVAHLARIASRPPVILPLAIEYAFWQERYPEALLAFGQPVDPADKPGVAAAELNASIATSLARAMDRLAAASRGRDAADFETILGGHAGVGGPYDVWRRMRASARGERFDPSHGGEPS